MLNSIHIVKKLDNASSEAVSKVVALIGSIDIKIVDKTEINKSTLIIAVGGDGTMLEAMRLSAMNDAFALGINLGRIGFLSDFTVDGSLKDTLCEIIEQERDNISGDIGVIRKKYPLERRHGLQLVYPTVGNTLPIAFNEFSIADKYSDTLLKYHLTIGEMKAGYHRANSLIIATPTGSTAYSLAAGGSLVLPSLDVTQITPVAPTNMTSRPIIVDSRSTIVIDLPNPDNVVIRADGQILNFKELGVNRIAITPAIVTAKLIHPPEWNFFQMLTKKLGWQQE